jgi:hypothetical protein
MEQSMAEVLTAETLKKRYEEARMLTANEIISKGNGTVDRFVFEEILRWSRLREAKEAAATQKKRASKKKLIADVVKVRKKLAKLGNKVEKLNNDDLKKLIQYKKKKGDKAMPTRKDDLIARYKRTKNNPSPASSPQNSDNEDSEEEENEEVESSDNEETDSGEESEDVESDDET